jgi:hypothetical protein
VLELDHATAASPPHFVRHDRHQDHLLVQHLVVLEVVQQTTGTARSMTS